jgi:hypothetical protein
MYLKGKIGMVIRIEFNDQIFFYGQIKNYQIEKKEYLFILLK